MKSLIDLDLERYQFELPPSMIAQRPLADKGEHRLLYFNRSKDSIKHLRFKDLQTILPKNALIVFNNTKVIKARLQAQKSTGGKVEIFILEVLEERKIKGLIGSNSKKEEGLEFFIKNKNEGDYTAKIIKRACATTFVIEFSDSLSKIIDECGQLPIPPYIRKGISDPSDDRDYQTCYSKHPGSVAAPTAGLHFTDEQMHNLKNCGHPICFVTLHVGAGTFSPVKSQKISDHQMHFEHYHIEDHALLMLNQSLIDHRPIVVVGTTSLRVLESCFDVKLSRFIFDKDRASTNIFIYPGKKIKTLDIISGFITNFHLPGSSLLMLVSALIGREKCLQLYRDAIEKKYRFFSYGDAMYIDLKGSTKS